MDVSSPDMDDNRPPDVKDGLPLFLREFLDQLYFIQDQKLPAPLQEVSLVLHEQLVRRDAHVEAVGFAPPLKRKKQTNKQRTDIRRCCTSSWVTGDRDANTSSVPIACIAARFYCPGTEEL